MALDKITTNIIEDDAITAAKIVAGAVEVDIRAGSVTGDKIGYLENATAAQTLSGTYSTERMYLNDSYQLTGDVTVTGHLALGTIADADVVITQDGTERTITGSGTLESGELMVSEKTDLTDMTGELGSGVTGGSGLTALGTVTAGNLSNSAIVYPAGHVLQADVIDITFQAGCQASEAGPESSITNSTGAQVLSTLLSPVSDNSTFIFQLGLHVDASGFVPGGHGEAIGLWVGTTLIIETYLLRTYADNQPMTHAGAGKYTQSTGADFNINLRAYGDRAVTLSVGQLQGHTVSNTQTGLFWMEVE